MGIATLVRGVKVGISEARRFWQLESWNAGDVYVFPKELNVVELHHQAKQLGLEVRWPHGWLIEVEDGKVAGYRRQALIDPMDPRTSMWRLTLDRSATGLHLAGVAVCTNFDEIRVVLQLVPSRDKTSRDPRCSRWTT